MSKYFSYSNKDACELVDEYHDALESEQPKHDELLRLDKLLVELDSEVTSQSVLDSIADCKSALRQFSEERDG